VKRKFQLDQVVYWRGQENKLCGGPIRRITEPQPGNLVLWIEIHEGRFRDDLFPINHRDVESQRKEKKG
jgi:hypothetical protein